MGQSWCIVALIQDAQAQIIMSGDDDTRFVAGNGCISNRCVLCIDPRKIDTRSVSLREIYEMEPPDDPLATEEPYLLCRLFVSSSNVDDGTLVTSVATVVSTLLLDCPADSKSDRRDNASTTTLSRPGLYSTEKLYSAKNDSHLAILCENFGLFTAVRNETWSV